jgi:hypothetical protein
MIFVVTRKAKLKTFRLLTVCFLLITVPAACNLPGALGVPTKTIEQYLTGTVPIQVNVPHTQTAAITATYTSIAAPPATPFPPNTPVWVIYKYTCEFTSGGGNMTMDLTWDDRSASEEGYKVYRDEQVIATLGPNSTHYVDVAFVATGETLSYFVEAFSGNWQAVSSTITYGCQ